MPKSQSTQKFTQIVDIVEDIVVFEGGNAALVIEVASSNFALLSREEQDAKVSAFAAFLNSLASPTQILIINRRIDISSYTNLLKDEIQKTQDPKAASYMRNYTNFVEQLVQENIVLDKKSYLVVKYSYLEGGVTHTSGGNAQEEFVTAASAALHTKADGLRSQIGRLNLPTKILGQQELLDLFRHLYNPDAYAIQNAQGGMQ